MKVRSTSLKTLRSLRFGVGGARLRRAISMSNEMSRFMRRPSLERTVREKRAAAASVLTPEKFGPVRRIAMSEKLQ